jgi:hypothetical protein
MDSNAVDRLACTAARSANRRRTLTLASALGLGGLFTIWDDGEAKKRKEKHRKCGPCRFKKKGKCKVNKPEGTACNGGICFDGRCVPQTCQVGGNCPAECRCVFDVNGIQACVLVDEGNCGVTECTSNAECEGDFCQVSNLCGDGRQTCVRVHCSA